MLKRLSLIITLQLLLIATAMSQNLKVYSTPGNGDDAADYRIYHHIKVVNEGANDVVLDGKQINYYIYESYSSESFSTEQSLEVTKDGTPLTGDVNNYVQFSFVDLENEYVPDTKMANKKIVITLQGGITLSPGQNAMVNFSVLSSEGNSINESDDWSYSSNSIEFENTNIVFQDLDGTVLTGTFPPNEIPGSGALAFTTQPTGEVVDITDGVTHTATITCVATGALSYQWQLDGGDITGATSNSYTITDVTAGSAGKYSVVISDGTTELTSDAAYVTVISQKPVDREIALGGAVNLALDYSASSEIMCEWTKDGQSKATTGNLNLTDISVGDAGAYVVTLKDPVGTVIYTASAQIAIAGEFVYPQECGAGQNMKVDGEIKCDAVIIGDWKLRTPDYVFRSDYKLRSLKNVEAFIRKNSHLPEVPSANEMKENGVNLSELNMLLLKKVEELTLYTISLQKQVEEQASILEKIKQ